MPLITLKDGTQVSLTVTELAEYNALLSSAGKPARKQRRRETLPGQDSEPDSRSPVEMFFSFISGDQDKKRRQRKILCIVFGRGEKGITLEELSIAIGDGGGNAGRNKTSGTIAGITKNAKKSRLDVYDVIFKDRDDIYRAGKVLQENKPPEP
ncbi:MAG: hypothetical protein HS104_11315 [Polyangiaceae bacterium]|nr:hypothetical protein [Polyangiaceae bacterium]